MRWLSVVLVGLVIGFVGCGGADVPSAVCNNCSGQQFQQAGCDGLGNTAGCESSTLEEVTDTACTDAATSKHWRCSFKNCKKQPVCPGP